MYLRAGELRKGYASGQCDDKFQLVMHGEKQLIPWQEVAPQPKVISICICHSCMQIYKTYFKCRMTYSVYH